MASANPAADQSVDAIVRDIYGSLLDDLTLRSCLQTVGRAFNSHITAIQSEGFQRKENGLDIIGEIDGPEFVAMATDYSTRWQGKNLWIERGIPRLLRQGYDTGDAVVTTSELLATEYYQHFLKPVDIRYGLGISLVNEGASSLAILTLNRAQSAGPFTPVELAKVAALRPHLVTAFAISRRLSCLHGEATTLRASFDRLSLGSLVLEADGYIVEKNEVACRLLSNGNGIACAAGGCLRLANPESNMKYRAALVRLANPHEAHSPEAIVVRGSTQASAGTLVLHLCAFPASGASVMSGRGRIIAFLCELNHHSEGHFSQQVLRAALELTPMEAAVVQSLRSHHDPAEVALELNLAVSTVRSHLKHLFHKTGTTRQGELLRLADRLLSAVPN